MSHNSRKTSPSRTSEENQVRDLSPSARSHSSTAGLEWDPSADVGTQVPSNTPVHRGNHLNNEGLSGLEQMVLAINYGYDLRSEVTDSRSHRSSARQDVHKSDGGSDSNNSSYKTATETDPSDQQDIPQTDNNVSTSLSNSEWQNSPSELMNKREDGSTTRSSSVVWVEVIRQEGDSSTRNNLTTTTTNTTTSTSENNVDAEASKVSSKKSVGVQVKKTKDQHKEVKDHHHKENKDHSHRIKIDNRTKGAARATQYSETQLPRHHHQPQVQECYYCVHGGHVPPPYGSGPIPTSSEYYHYPIPIQCHCYGMTIQGPGSGAALQSQGTQSSNNGGGGGKRKGGSESEVSKSSSTDLTPTCLLIDKLIKERNVTLKNYGYQALEEHRQSLVRQMRKELHHLEKLNKMLLDKKKQRSSSSSTTTPSALTTSSLDHSKSDKHKNLSSTPSQFEDTETVVKHTQIYTQKISQPADKPKNNVNKNAPSSSEMKQQHQQKQPKHKKQEKYEQQETEKREPISYFLPFPSYPNYYVQTSQKHQKSKGGKENNNNHHNGHTSKLKKKTAYDNGGGGHSYSDDSDNNVIFENDNIQISLQQAFQQHCPNVLASVQQRENILNNLRHERECRGEIKREYFSTRNNCLSPNDSLNNALPPKEPRLMSIRQMKELTEKKLKNLPEVREKIQKRRVEEDKKTYRVMSQVFSRKLRQNVLKGDVNVVHTRSLIRR